MYGVSNIMVEKMGNWQYELDKISELARQNKNMSEFGSLSDNKTRIEHIMHNKYIECVYKLNFSSSSSYLDRISIFLFYKFLVILLVLLLDRVWIA